MSFLPESCPKNKKTHHLSLEPHLEEASKSKAPTLEFVKVDGDHDSQKVGLVRGHDKPTPNLLFRYMEKLEGVRLSTIFV